MNDQLKVPLELVRQLNSETGVSVIECKKVLVESKLDMDEARKALIQKGMSTVAKKSSRIAADGAIFINVGDKDGLLLEINCETDFVARNEKFQDFCLDMGKYAVENSDAGVDELIKAKDEDKTKLVSSIGENITPRRAARLKGDHIFGYMHNLYDGKSNLGRIGVLLSIKSDLPRSDLEELGNNICMHIAAFKPLALNADSLDPKIVKDKEDMFILEIKRDKKPDNLIERILQGKMNGFFSQVALLKQSYVMEESKNVETIISEYSQKHGKDISIEDFKLFVLGDGIEKIEEDFAEAVQKVVKEA